MLCVLHAAGLSTESLPGLEEALCAFPDPFENIDTHYRREIFYFNYVVCSMHAHYMRKPNAHPLICIWYVITYMQAPQEIPFCDPYFVNQFTGPKRLKVKKSDCFYYIPLLKTLRSLLALQEVQKEVFNPHFSEQHELRDYCAGLLYKSHPLFCSEENALQIIGYYDEVEVVNPIGSYVSRHKLGCLFFTIGNLQPIDHL